ncbi:MAG: hypothetical protein GEV07_28655 [Streptosporangiales bacterium]|nr:hypothetical protein [Streptosporangiales bacterium]
MELSAAQVIGGALAAASAAAAASVLGVYGTVIGAVVVSVVASVGGAVYTHSFRKGSQKIKESSVPQTLRLRRPVAPGHAAVAGSTADEQLAAAEERPDGPPTVRLAADGPSTERLTPADEYTAERLAAAGAHLAAADEQATERMAAAGGEPTERLAAAEGEPTERLDPADGTTGVLAAGGAAEAGGERVGWRQRLAGINPKAVVLTGVAVLVLSLSGIVFVESLLGQPLSSAFGHGDGKGGNSISRALQGGGGAADDEESPTPTPSSTPTTETGTPTATPTAKTSSPATSQVKKSTAKSTTSTSTSPTKSSSRPTTQLPTSTTSGGLDGDSRERLPAE